MFVCDGGRLVGVVTRKTLVREVVAAGRDPRATQLRRDRRGAALHARRRAPARRGVPLARGARPGARAGARGRPPRRRPLAQRCPAPAGRGRAAGRRRASASAAGVGAGRRGALLGLGQLGRRERGAVEDVPLARLELGRARRSRAPRTRIAAPGDDHRRPPRLDDPARRSSSGQRREPRDLLADGLARDTWPWTRSGSYSRARGRARRASSPSRRRRRACTAVEPAASSAAHVRSRIAATSSPKRSVRRTQPTSRLVARRVGADDLHLGRAAADVDDERAGLEPAPIPRSVSSASSSPLSSRVAKP